MKLGYSVTSLFGRSSVVFERIVINDIEVEVATASSGVIDYLYVEGTSRLDFVLSGAKCEEAMVSFFLSDSKKWISSQLTLNQEGRYKGVAYL